MAVPAENLPMQSKSGRKLISPVQHLAIRMYADGKTRRVVANLLLSHLSETKSMREANKTLRNWEETQWFRDAVYDYAMAKADMALPQILLGMRQKAKKRVDAARLMLEVTGRHNPRGEAPTPAVVQINFGGTIPRPLNRPQAQLSDPEMVEGEVVAEEDE